MKNDDLQFDRIYRELIKEWPRKLELIIKSEVLQTVEEHPDGYQIVRSQDGKWNGNEDGYVVYISKSRLLMDLVDEISEKNLNPDFSVIFENFHYVVGKIARKIALYSSIIYPESLRKESIEYCYKKELKDIYGYGDSLWDEEDKKKINEYFRINYPNEKL